MPDRAVHADGAVAGSGAAGIREGQVQSKGRTTLTATLLAALCSIGAFGGQTTSPSPDAVRTLVDRLDMEAYKASIKALTQFGDRLQGTDRNRAAIDWRVRRPRHGPGAGAEQP